MDEYPLDDSPPGKPRIDGPALATIDLTRLPRVAHSLAKLPEQPEADSSQVADSVKLEIRGVTSQPSQFVLWSKQTIYKNSVAAKLRSIGLKDEAHKLENCHTQYTFAVCNGCNHVSKFPNRCDLFYCPECQPRLANDRRRAVEWWTREVQQPKHVVLTVKNISDLTSAHVREFVSWFNKLRRRKFARNWLGGFRSLEVTNEGNGWHLHLHALVNAQWIDSFKLSEEWQSVTNGLGRIVKVKDARQKNYLAEVTKYAVKGVELSCWSPDKIKTFIRAFEGVRTFAVFGSLYGLRTKFAEWFKFIRDQKPLCKCGCSDARYFSESEFLELDLVPRCDNACPIPPPQQPHPEFGFVLSAMQFAALSR
jgi:hypothetical protein